MIYMDLVSLLNDTADAALKSILETRGQKLIQHICSLIALTLICVLRIRFLLVI